MKKSKLPIVGEWTKKVGDFVMSAKEKVRKRKKEKVYIL